MSKRLLARCGDAARRGTDDRYDEEVDLRQQEPGKNVNLVVTNVTGRIVDDVSPAGRDLLDIAAYIYVLDSSTRRGGPTDIYGHSWARDFTVRVPVREPSLWNEHRSRLERLLGYLTDDQYRFEFVEHSGDVETGFLEFESYEPFPGSDCICLFSGGADSLAGAIHLVRTGRRPLLVSHRSVSILDKRQRNLRAELAKRMNVWTFPHMSVWAHRRGPAKSYSQRSRSFLYLCIGATIGDELGFDDVFLPENGIVSLNLPKTEQAVGARSSRSTHPRFVREFQEMASSLLGRSFHVENPFIFRTKAEVLRILEEAELAELLELAVSCAHTRAATKATPHCGDCSQCVDRRFAAEACALEAYDPRERYRRDVFWDDLEGAGRKQVAAHVRLARRLEQQTATDFFLSHRSAADAVAYLPGTTSAVGEALYDLHRRFATETLAVVEKQVEAQARDIARGRAAPRGLVALLSDPRLTAPPAAVMATLIAEFLNGTIPVSFRSRRPKKETELQDAIEAMLKGAERRLRREGPAVSYSLIKTVPDFSSEESRTDLYIEVKLVKDRDSLRYAIKSIGEASSYYVDQGAYVLFVVYDTDRHIIDDKCFAEPFESKPNVQVAVIR